MAYVCNSNDVFRYVWISRNMNKNYTNMRIVCKTCDNNVKHEIATFVYVVRISFILFSYFGARNLGPGFKNVENI